MPDVLIFDDDPAMGDAAREALGRRGLTVEHHLSGAGVAELVEQGRPRLVVLDIMMRGQDGLSACRALRANPATKAVKIVVVSGRNYKAVEQRARLAGADLFLGKPFDPDALGEAAARLLELAPAPAAPGPGAALGVSLLRGAAVLEAPGLWVALDAGPGLAAWLKTRPKPPAAAWVLLSRYEPWALESLDALKGLVAAGTALGLAGPEDPEGTLQFLAPRLGAAGASGKRALPAVRAQREGEFEPVPGLRVALRYTLHPDLAVAYRVELLGRSVVYCPAHDIPADPRAAAGHEAEKFRALFKGADLLIHGYRHGLADAVAAGQPRCAWEPAVDLAAAAGVKRLALVALPASPPVKDLPALAAKRASAAGADLACLPASLPQSLFL